MNENTINTLKKYIPMYGSLGRALSMVRFNLDITRPQLLTDIGVEPTKSNIHMVHKLENCGVTNCKIIPLIMKAIGE
jgi:hypothetical protein